jgi:predicted ATPase
LRLVEVVIENFRGFRQPARLQIDVLTAFVGKNDAGKSTILEALELILAKDAKLDDSDICVKATAGQNVTVECIFDDLPDSLSLDAGSRTTLDSEYLVAADGRLHLGWSWTISNAGGRQTVGKPKVYVRANHPAGKELGGLHIKKNEELKKLVAKSAPDVDCDLTNNAKMRQALWEHARAQGKLQLEEVKLELTKEDGKTICEQLLRCLPLFVLFRADRASTDDDSEVQDPMKVAVREALRELEGELAAIKDKIKERSLDVANRTLVKLQDFAPDLAATLEPDFKAEPKWDGIFKLSLSSDDGIPVNKRGSGVRRLLLFSFFRAEAERRQAETLRGNVIYAVEEPETAQHPQNQKAVVEALRALSEQDGCQILLTTHIPGLASLLPVSSLRLVEKSCKGTTVQSPSPDVYKAIVASLGVVPDKRARVIVCVEGPNDISLLRAACRAWRTQHPDLVCLDTDPRVAVILLGGSTLKEWVNEHLLRNLDLPEFHIYDSDLSCANGTPKYDMFASEVNSRGGSHSARSTIKREMENYLDPACIDRVLQPIAQRPLLLSQIGPYDDVETALSLLNINNGNPSKKLQKRTLKSWLNNEVARAMTYQEWVTNDPNQEFLGWFQEITSLATN